MAHQISRELLTIHVQKKDDPTEQLFVFFPDDPKVGVKPIRKYEFVVVKVLTGRKIDIAIV